MPAIPLLSDRSAFDVDNYPEKHASDLAASAPKNHVPAGSSANDLLRWDGSKWVAGKHKLTTLGTVEGDIALGETPFKIYNRFGVTRTITEIFLVVATAPTGADLIVDIKVDGVSIFSGSLASIADAAVTGVQTTINAPSWAAGSYLTWEVTQVGSTTPGANLVIHITHE